MTASSVQAWNGASGAGPTLNASFTNVPAAGNLLVWYAELDDDAAATGTFTDNMTDGGAWAQVSGSPLVWSPGPAVAILLWKVVGASANSGKQLTVTKTAGTVGNIESWFTEIKNDVAATWALDAKTAQSGGPSGTPNSANALTLSSSNNFNVGTIVSGRAPTAVAGYTRRVNLANDFRTAVEDGFNKASPTTPSWTISSDVWACFGASWKATVGGGGGATPKSKWHQYMMGGAGV